MHILLTHEQADFDALASLLGAYLLDEDALPVLPRRMNRNVHAFLALYGADLPFLDPRDLPAEPVEVVTLVDTQSMVSVKGMSASTRVRVIDHHPIRDNLPADWVISLEEIGATTTMLIEALREHNGLLSPIQATLLLLGIYEDTGSLTYTRTTARDLRAAAYLIEQGASLQIASSFLNHPLSHAQQEFYERLRTNAEHYHIHGYTVVMACGDALEMDEELSSIVHKLRDLLDPDAIFIVVTTRSGVQLIARSTTDNIDVSTILANFGGGGHERAAACLIRGRDVDSVRVELIGLLPQYIRPAVTVAQIMSLGAQVLSPDTLAEEAAVRMRRYGYEGYPVVQDGKVIGLLTRRAVDRALSHRLNLPVIRLMEAGEHTVEPDDSVEYLQRLVTETGWGQVPVVDPQKGEVIGIVTRTDLLKTLTPHSRLPGSTNLASRLEAALPADRLGLLRTIAEAAYDQRSALYIVGGFVRDLLLERPSLDFDLVVEGDAVALAHALAHQYGGRVTSHTRFGTAKWHILTPSTGGSKPGFAIAGLEAVDLVSARTEFYTHPTALPTVERGGIKLDLHRRDFTINTMALRLDGRHYGELHDYWGGFQDLRSGLVRILHSLSFVDDPTRILRAVRFEQRFEFRIEERTMELLQEARPMIARLSGDRIRHEVNHILDSPARVEILARLHDLGLLTDVHPDLGWDDWLRRHLQALAALNITEEWQAAGLTSDAITRRELAYILWMIRFPAARAISVAERLKLPVALQKNLRSACSLWPRQEELVCASPSRLVACLEDQPIQAVYALFLASADVELRQLLRSFVSRWRMVAPHTTGDDLRKLGLPPGPQYRRILDALRDAWLDGTINSHEDELVMLDILVSQDRSHEV
ncbi:MAG: CBS domain-containing protein [Anaerolineales bacterium]|nr:CBS domain-containing protein [Anaerolineales bacterium]